MVQLIHSQKYDPSHKMQELNGLTFQIFLSFFIQDILLLAYMRRVGKRECNNKKTNKKTKNVNTPNYKYIL